MGEIVDKVKKYLKKIDKEDVKGINSFLHVNRAVLDEAKALESRKGKRGRLYGKVIGVKSNINVKSLVANCASKTLGNYVSTYDASVIEKIKKEDGLIIGMLNMDEFAAGSSGETSNFGPTMNPKAKGRIPGGSSSGSAAAVAAGFCDVALGSDTGGSIRNPASNCGIIGVKPSYGAVSRYGLIDLSMSLDQIGVLASNVDDAGLVLDVIRGKDDRDTTTVEIWKNSGKIGKVKIGVVGVKGVDRRIQELVDKRVGEIIKRLGWSVKEIEIKYIDLAVQTYYLLNYVEFFSATRRFDGRKYGNKIEDVGGEEVLRRILGGSEISKEEFSGRYYDKALQVKRLIGEEFGNAFGKVDCLIMPTLPMFPWKIGQTSKMRPKDIYASDALTTPASLAGVCAISIPAGEIDGIPVGMQVVCGKGEDGKMISIAREIEKLQL
jgi:aspartyl-tRNA(Asn)/glutamyl-tRNA(Gln) amidotransferase subunit A